MSIPFDKGFYNYLCTFVSEQRLQRFQQVANSRLTNLTVVLAELHDIQNVNAIIRTAECCGLHELHVIESQTRMKRAKSIARGSYKWLKPTMHPEGLTPCLLDLKAKGFSIVAADLQPNAATPATLDISKPVALLMGREKQGVAPEALALCDAVITIPNYGFTESYNVSVAAGICLYTLSNRMRQEGKAAGLPRSIQEQLLYNWVLKTVRAPELLYKRWKAEQA
ncbi:MAG: RNA methyltransferase [Chitinophagales bacterium]